MQAATREQRSRMTEQVDREISRKVHAKYMIMIIRQKISFMAFLKN